MVRRRNKAGIIDVLLWGTRHGKAHKMTKKRQKEIEEQWKFEVKDHVAREIWAVVCFASSILIALSLANQLGLVGEWINIFLKPIFGYGLYIIPPLFLTTAILLVLSKKIRITMAKLTGMGLFIIAILSILHLSVNPDNILESAKLGQYGGYIGFITNYFFRITLRVGNLGASIIFVATFLVSLLLTFEVSILESLGKLFIREDEKPRGRAENKRGLEETTSDKEHEEINIIKPDVAINSKSESSDEDEEDVQPTLFSHDHTEPEKITEEAETEDPSMLEAEISEWEFPSTDLLENETSKIFAKDSFLIANAERIKEKLHQFDIDVSMGDVHVGPTVIQYTLKPNEGVKLSKITNLKNDLALALAAKSIRIEAPIPGKSLVGIEVPTEKRTIVKLKEILASEEYKKMFSKSKLSLPLGRDVSGKPIIAELNEMPHFLIAGATGAGKSVAINVFLISLLYQNSPADLKLILIDPKQVELRDYNGIPHLLTSVITDPDKAANALKWAVAEMNRRYSTLSHAGCRNIDEYNAEDGRERKMPKIIILIDELADLMMANGKEVETTICRIAQMARAVGIHLIIATQRPSVDVITGLIKANIPTRASFAVASQIDSRTILDSAGAEDLLGKGDMLYLQKDFAKPIRVQGIFISPNEIKRVTNKLKLTFEPEYKNEITEKHSAKNPNEEGFVNSETDDDELYDAAFEIIIQHRKASASLLQRKLKIGYARAARLLDLLEEKGVVGPVNGAKPREIYVNE